MEPSLHSPSARRRSSSSRTERWTLALLSFLTNYNDFLWPIYVHFNPESLTLPPGLAILGFSYQTDYAVIMAGGVIASIPVLIIFVIAQRYVIEGIARSGIKG